MKRHFTFLSLSIMFISCQTEQKFDKIKWAEVADLMTFPNRKYMINDLVKNYKIKGESYIRIIDLLSQPQSNMNHKHEVFYDIEVDYGFDIDPIYTKVLILQFSKDSIVQTFEVKEYKK